MARAASATLNVEATALSEGLAEVERVATWFGLARDPGYLVRSRDTLNREFAACSIISEKEDSHIEMAAITDAKSLFDNLARGQYSGAGPRWKVA